MPRKAKPKPPPAASADPFAARSGNGLTRLLFRPRVLVCLAVAVSSTVAVPRLRDALPDLSQREEYLLRASEIEITPPPRWVPPNLVEQVTERSGLPERVSLLDTDLTREVAEAFRVHPWVAEVLSVQKSAPARLTVELQYRRPVAMVEVKQGMYPVDGDGVLLPPADFSLAQAKRYPVVENVTSTPQGPSGVSWGDVGVLGAARLAEILGHMHDGEESAWKKFGLTAIRVPRQTKAEMTTDDMLLELITTGGSRIIWGRPPGSGHPGELSAAQKIGRMEKYVADFGGFDQPHGPYEIDIRHWQEISRRPLTAGSPRRRQ